MKRKSQHTASPFTGKGPRKKLDQKRKIDILGILLIVFSVLVFLALVSNSAADESVADIRVTDFMKLFFGDPDMKARADVTSNWLGLIGAFIARFFINYTIGYFALVFPVFLGLWGWFILRKKDVHALAYYTNYSLLLAFLIATFAGLLRLLTWMPTISVAWAGNIGDFIAGLISSLIGTTGGIIVIPTTIVILAVIVVDYDIHVSLDRMRAVGEIETSLVAKGRIGGGE